MKKWLFAFVISLGFYSGFANHILGGEITWECDGNNKYIFQLVLYGDCSDSPISTNTYSLAWSGGAPIACTLLDSSFISPTCGNSAFAINCDSTAFFTPVKRYVYKSLPVQLVGTIPATGWSFSLQIQARPITDNTNGGATNGYLLRAIMYPYMVNGVLQSRTNCYDNSPKFQEVPRYAFGNDTNFYHLDGYEIDSQDSVFFNWAPALNYGTAFPGTSLSYAAGYAYNQPLPGPGISGGNANATLLGNGRLSFKSITLGRFTTCYLVESWRNGQKISEVYRDFEMQVNVDLGSPGICGGAPNSPPSITFAWLPGFDTLTAVYDFGQIAYYETTIFAGETVKFNLSGQDFDLSPNCTSQEITASAIGASMSKSLLGVNDCDGPPCAQLISLNTGGSYSSFLSNQTRFEWLSDTSHADGPNGYGVHIFNLSFTDGHCVLPAVGQQQVRIKVLRPIYSSKSMYKICQGDTVHAKVLGDTSNLSWSPATSISCTSCASPLLYPNQTTNYLVTDVNTGYITHVTVQVDATPATPALTQSGSDFLLTNASTYDTITWRRSGAAFYPQPTTNYTPWLTGDYWVEGSAGVCKAISDTFSLEFADNLSAMAGNNGVQKSLENGLKTYGATIRLNNENFYSLDGFYLHAFDKNAQGANLATLTCKVYNQSQATVFQSDSVTRVSDDILKFHGEVNVGSNQDYLISFYVDTSVVLPTCAPLHWPVVANNGRVFVYNASRAAGNSYPSTSATEYPFFHVSLKYGIGLAENTIQNVRIYPNPANEVLHLKSANNVVYVITNALGQSLAKGSFYEEKTLDISTWKSGLYIVNFWFENGTSSSNKLEIVR